MLTVFRSAEPFATECPLGVNERGRQETEQTGVGPCVQREPLAGAPGMTVQVELPLPPPPVVTIVAVQVVSAACLNVIALV